MKPWIKAAIGILVLGGIAAGVIFAYLEMSEERKSEAEMEAPVQAPSRLARGPEREVLVLLDEETRKRIALETQPLAEALYRPERVAYGRLLEDPSGSQSVRAPVAGTLRKIEDRAWPSLGEKVEAGSPLSRLIPRFAPAERADLQARLSSARADAEQAATALGVSRAALVRARTLNAEDKNVSDRVLQEAEARVKSEEARQKSATELATFFEGAITGNGPAAALTIAVEQGGEVVELLARPGEAVESGQGIVRLARYDRLLARVTLPSGDRLDGKPVGARVSPVGYEDQPLKGEWISAATADPQAPGETHLFRVASENTSLRPGVAVVARIELPGEPQRGVLVPSASVVRFGGRVWAYAQVAEGKFMRRELEDGKPAEKGWYASSGWKTGEKVVVSGAGLLLSEELKSQIQVQEEGK